LGGFKKSEMSGYIFKTGNLGGCVGGDFYFS